MPLGLASLPVLGALGPASLLLGCPGTHGLSRPPLLGLSKLFYWHKQGSCLVGQRPLIGPSKPLLGLYWPKQASLGHTWAQPSNSSSIGPHIWWAAQASPGPLLGQAGLLLGLGQGGWPANATTSCGTREITQGARGLVWPPKNPGAAGQGGLASQGPKLAAAQEKLHKGP